MNYNDRSVLLGLLTIAVIATIVLTLSGLAILGAHALLFGC